MRPHRGPVNVKLRPVDLIIEIHVLTEFSKDAMERAILGPGAKSVIDGLPVAITLGQVAPRGAGAEDPEDGVDDGTGVVVEASSTGPDCFYQTWPSGLKG
jgi:hypothetical protein